MCEERESYNWVVDRLDNGNILCQRDNGVIIEVEPETHKVVRVTTLDMYKKRPKIFSRFWGVGDRHFVVEDRHVIIDDLDTGMIVEASPTGKTLARFATISSDLREVIRPEPGRLALADGYLVGHIVEVDRQGRCSWETYTEGEIGNLQSIYRLVSFGFPEPDYATGDLTTITRRLPGLRSPMKPVRIGTAYQLKVIGEAALPALPGLVSLMNDADGEVRDSAAAALSNLGPAAAPTLIELWRSSNPIVRRSALGNSLDLDTRIARLWDPGTDGQSQGFGFQVTPQYHLYPTASHRLCAQFGRSLHPLAGESGLWCTRVCRRNLVDLGSEITQSFQCGSWMHAFPGTLNCANMHSKKSPGTSLLISGCLISSFSAIKEGDEEIRRSALDALGRWKSNAKPAIPALLATYSELADKKDSALAVIGGTFSKFSRIWGRRRKRRSRS